MTGTITDFYPGVTKRVRVTCREDGVLQNITGDAVIWRIKRYHTDSDAAALLEVMADVLTEGATGVARLEIAPADSNDVAPGYYWTDIVWERMGGDEHVTVAQKIRILDRVSDAV